MIKIFEEQFKGQFAELADHFFLIDEIATDFEPALQIFHPDRLDSILKSFAKRYEEPEPRAVASQWSKLYFARLILPAAAAAILFDWQLRLDLSNICIALDDDGGNIRFGLPSKGIQDAVNNSRERFSFLVDDHLRHVIPVLSDVSGLPHKVLWSNAGNIVENVVQRSAALLGPEHQGVRDGQDCLATRRFEDGSLNPLFEPVRYVDNKSDVQRKRRICCLRYFIPSLSICKTCPLERA
ncbi:siderophore-iron reductase FhuF [Brucella pseudogrignonensis]|uniref:siderophore-iron reductase FhuF n=1 Tax=Brucella pseudogrignonensis TaxID=419475 RepID=UPI0038B68027